MNSIASGTVLITGPTGGLGKAAALAIANRPARKRPDLLLIGRAGQALTEVAEEARAAGATVHAIGCDLARLAEVRETGQKVRDLLDARAVRPLRGLVANAGISSVDTRTASTDGYELTFAVNYLAHAQLIGDLLGMPQEERGPLRRWSLAILGALEPRLTPQQFETGVRAVAEFKAYLADLIARRRDQGGADGREILSTLINASEFAAASDAGGEQLSELELIHNCIFLLNAGHETTTNLIGNGVDLLLRHPDAREDLAEHPELIDTAIEEFLRLESSNQLGNRRATRDTTLNGVAIPAKTYVHLCVGAANRDPAQFPEPDRLDIRRSPNRHLAFGLGIHACAGMSLARMEARVAISKLVARFPTIRRAGDPVRGGRARFRGFLHLPVAIHQDGQ